MKFCGWLPASGTLLLLTGGEVFARLAQKATNGYSLLGDLSEPPLAEYLTDNPLPDGFPWAHATAFNTNYYTSSPDTGLSFLIWLQETNTNLLKASQEGMSGQCRGVPLHLMGTRSQ
jgi:hypothetical protein